MYASSIPVICYYNGHIVRTDNDVKYDGNKASIVPLHIPVDCTWVISYFQAHLLTNRSSN